MTQFKNHVYTFAPEAAAPKPNGLQADRAGSGSFGDRALPLPITSAVVSEKEQSAAGSKC